MSRKASGRLYTHVLDLMKKNGGRLDLDSPELAALLANSKTGKSTMYRAAGYIYDIRKYAALDVTAIRTGRKVIAYELVALSPAPAQPAEPEPVPTLSDGTVVVEASVRPEPAAV